MTQVEPLAGHALWATTYDSHPNPVLALEQRTLARLMPPMAGQTVADVACGTGRWGHSMREQARQVISIDLCPEMLERAPAPHLLADAKCLPLKDGCADVTVCAMALSYAGVACLGELARITRANGRVLISDLHPAAVEAGWKRAFRAGGREVSIQFQPFRLIDLAHPDLELVGCIEAHFGEPEREVFAVAGKEHRFAAMAQIPAVFAAMWVRRAD